MSMAPDMRAGDEDRDRTAGVLREAFAEGRLDAEEFQQRLDRVLEAKTCGQLSELVDDLPAAAPSASASASVSVPTTATVVAPANPEGAHNLRNGWASWAGVSVLVNVIYFATWMSAPGSPPYYWPIWVMGPWGAAMLIGTLSRRE